MSSRRPCWEIYNEEMSQLNNGHALWQPSPLSYFERILPGDVGYIREGCFHLLFSASSPPHSLKKLDIGRIFNPLPQAPGYLTGCRETTVDFEPSTSPSSESPVRMLEPGCSFKFHFTEEQGAALVTKYQIYKENVQAVGNSKKYTKENYASWVEYARDAWHGDVNPVLVTGVDRTRDFSIMCYSNYNGGLECEFRTADPGSNFASAWGTWKTSRFIHTKDGPQSCVPSASTQTMDVTPSGNRHSATVSDEHNQCVFVRYFTMRCRRLRAPKIIKAGAGPHNPGFGDRDNGGSPPETQRDSDSSSDRGSSALDSGGENSSSASSIDSGSSSLIHNPTIRERDDFDVLADYIFQNSHADSALLHHQDLRLLREVGLTTTRNANNSIPQPGGSNDLPTQLLQERPQVTVDENGVGMIRHGDPGFVAHPLMAASHHPLSFPRSQAEPHLPESPGLGLMDITATTSIPGPSHTSRASTPDSSSLSSTGSTHSSFSALSPVSSIFGDRTPTSGGSATDCGVCCTENCGILVPLLTNGMYMVPGKIVSFNLVASPTCGIPVVNVLRGNLEGFVGRDELAELNPNADSLRLRIEWPGYERFVRKVNTPARDFTIEKLARAVCKHLSAFFVSKSKSFSSHHRDFSKENARVSDSTAPEWAVGEGGIFLEQLVLVSLKRISIGSWAPCIRLEPAWNVV